MKSTIMVKICERRKKNILEISISFWHIYLEISDYNSLIFRNQELLKENESSYKTFPNIARILSKDRTLRNLQNIYGEIKLAIQQNELMIIKRKLQGRIV